MGDSQDASNLTWGEQEWQQSLDDDSLSFDSTSLHVTYEGKRQRVVQLYETLPFLKPFYPFEWENNFTAGEELVEFCARNMYIPFILVSIYMAFVFGAKSYLANREPYNIRESWKWWNLGLSIFSFCGAIRTLPHLIHNLVHPDRGLHYSICHPAETGFANGAAGLWACLFVFSKIPELIDTAFIVLGKRKLIFLHWYHHVTVLLVCWHTYATRTSSGLWFVSMNYTVHTIMYGYYFLSNYYRPSWAKLVTLMQISQMFVGVVICYLVWHYKTFSPESRCNVSNENWLAGFAMYLSYFALFVYFFTQRYSGSSKKASSKNVEAVSKKVD